MERKIKSPFTIPSDLGFYKEVLKISYKLKGENYNVKD